MTLADRSPSSRSQDASDRAGHRFGICHGVDGILTELGATRQAIRETGCELIAAGLHPAADSGEAKLVPKPRYEVVRKGFGDLLRTPPCGLHVHVGIPDPDIAVRVARASFVTTTSSAGSPTS